MVRDLEVCPGVDYLLAGAPRGSWQRSGLRAAGFLSIPLGPTLMTRCLVDDAELEAHLRSDSWRLSAGDLEVF